MRVDRPVNGTGEPYGSPHTTAQKRAMLCRGRKNAARECRGEKSFAPTVAARPPLIRAINPGHVFFRDAATVPAMAGGWQGENFALACRTTLAVINGMR